LEEKYTLYFDIRDNVLEELLTEALNPYFHILSGVKDVTNDFDIRLTDKTDHEEHIQPSILFLGKENGVRETDTPKLNLPCKISELYVLMNRLIEQSKTNLFGGKILNIGPITLVYDSGEIQKKGFNENIKLTEKEKEILCYLYANKDTIVSKNALLDDIWGYSEELETHTLETHIYRLRQKIEIDPTEPEILVTDDKGYKLNL
jgi:DNA-binding winged helix-turn-helix (wHTH) protein